MKKSVDKVNNVAVRPDARTATRARAEPGDQVFEAIHDLMHLYRAQQYRALREAPLELTHMEGKVLGFFARRPGATLSDLVAHSGRDKGQLARLIGSLRERELLEAQADAEDRRTLRLHPTAQGKALHDALSEQAHRVASVAIKGLGADERRALLDLLARVRANLAGAD